jgi:gliding motility-associated GldN-like protein
MKKIATTATLCALIIIAFAQNNSTFIRRDTIVLKSSECNWLVKQNSKQTVGESVLHAIETGKLKAIDPNSGKIIPASKISTWTMPVDTAAVYNKKADRTEYQVVQAKVNPSRISQIRMQQDWYLDVASGKIFSEIKWIEPRLELYSGSDTFIGYRTFCHIDYPGN